MSEPQFSSSVVVVDNAILLQGVAVSDVERLVALGLRTLQTRDGNPQVSPRVLSVYRALNRVATDYRSSVLGTAEDRELAPGAVLSPEVLINTQEASMILQVSERQVRKLAPQLHARRAGRFHVFDRAAVTALAAQRAAGVR